MSTLKSLVFAQDIEGVDEWLRDNPRPSASELSGRYLGLAIARDDLELVKVLVEHGADPDHHLSLDPKYYKNYGFLTRFSGAADEFGHTVLHYACHQLRMARLLIESGADVNGVDPRKNTPLHETSNGAGVRGLIPLLVNAGAHVNARNWRRVTPLHNACRRGSLTNARALLSRGAHIDALDTNRESPIFRCVGDRREGLGDSDMLAVVKFLVAQGADLTIRNRKGIGLAPRSAYGGPRRLSNWRGERAMNGSVCARAPAVELPACYEPEVTAAMWHLTADTAASLPCDGRWPDRGSMSARSPS